MKPLVVVLLWFALTVAPVTAQDLCPNIVLDALESTRLHCAELGRDQACYGNLLLNATGTLENFDSPGDIEDVAHIESLRLSAMNLTEDTWGIALVRLHADLPDSLTQDITLALFGDVTLTNAVVTQISLPATALTNANVRLRPTTDSSNVVGSLARNEVVSVNGRLEDSSWLRVFAPPDLRGWVFAELLQVDGDIESLEVVGAQEQFYGPMQAFYLQTGQSDSLCVEAPSSGLLVQTPEGAGSIDFLINEVHIRLGSTAYLQAQPADEMVINILDGTGVIEAQNDTVVVPAGARTRIALDASGNAAASPSYPEPYETSNLSALPLSLLPLAITAAAPLTQSQLDTLLSTPVPPNPAPVIQSAVLEGPCDNISFTITWSDADGDAREIQALNWMPGTVFPVSGTGGTTRWDGFVCPEFRRTDGTVCLGRFVMVDAAGNQSTEVVTNTCSW